MKKSWLVNDTLTCIPGTKTLWHDLLEWIPDLEDPVNGYIPFNILPYVINNKATKEKPPDIVIRNCTFFPRLAFKAKTISILQDIYDGNIREQQLDVALNSELVIFNSEFTKSFYPEITTNFEIIPLGIDFTFFNIDKNYSEELGILPNSILFIGASNSYPKGFDLLTEIINKTNYNFCLIMKDDYKINHPRIKVFNRVNAVTVKKIINSCKLCLCTSKVETQHLAGLEAAACNLPLLTTNVGAYYNRPDGDWGKVCHSLDHFLENIRYTLNNLEKFSSREYFLNQGFDKKDCMAKWKKLCEEI